MRYEKIAKGRFVSRPNRFIAEVLMDGQDEIDGQGVITRVHVKNTGRCKELLPQGARLYLEDFTERMGTRKLEYSLIGVEKVLPDGSRLMINMDSQAPNKVAEEALADGRIVLPGMGKLTEIRREKTWGDSRFDFYVEDENGRKGFIEVKGVTLEDEGVVRFPDAPTQRGVKHLQGLMKARAEGYFACALFIVQMEGMKVFMPNDETHPEFGKTLREAARSGVEILAYQCKVTEDTLEVTVPLRVEL